MKLWLDGRPGLEDPPEELASKAWRALSASPMGPPELPVYRTAGLAVRFRFVYELPEGPLEVRPPMPATPATPTLAWFWTQVLEGLLWESAGQVAQVTARKEWGRLAGVEVTV